MVLKTYPKFLVLLLLLSFFISSGFTPNPSEFISFRSYSKTQSLNNQAIPKLADFVNGVSNGGHEKLVGVYVNNVMALPIVSQPDNDPTFVSSFNETATNFSLTTKFGTIGLLAHNHLAGSHFFELNPKDNIILVYGDGSLKYYEIEKILRYRALTPLSPYSNFSDVNSPNTILTSSELFNQIYTKEGLLVLQTCIASMEVQSWGRLFVIAHPVEVINQKGSNTHSGFLQTHIQLYDYRVQ